MDFDPGIADRADGDRQGEALQQREVDAKATRFVKGRLLRARMVRSNRSGVDVAHGRIGAHQLGQKLDDDARPQRKIPSGRIHHRNRKT